MVVVRDVSPSHEMQGIFEAAAQNKLVLRMQKADGYVTIARRQEKTPSFDRRLFFLFEFS